MVYLIQVCWHIPLLCVQWKTPDDGQRNCPKHVDFNSKNKFEKLAHLVSFIIRIYHDARSPERQKFHFPTRCAQCTHKIPVIRQSLFSLSNYAVPHFCSFLHLPFTSCRLGPYILLNVLFYRHQFFSEALDANHSDTVDNGVIFIVRYP